MPKPVYIVCANSVTVDRESNFVSILNVIEKLDVTVQIDKTPDGGRPTSRFHITEAQAVAVWSKVPGDDGKEFESQFRITSPEGTVSESPIVPFEFEKGKLLHRFILKINVMPFHESGTLQIESAVRKKGTNTWQSQSYEIVIERTVKIDPLLADFEQVRRIMHKVD